MMILSLLFFGSLAFSENILRLSCPGGDGPKPLIEKKIEMEKARVLPSPDLLDFSVTDDGQIFFRDKSENVFLGTRHRKFITKSHAPLLPSPDGKWLVYEGTLDLFSMISASWTESRWDESSRHLYWEGQTLYSLIPNTAGGFSLTETTPAQALRNTCSFPKRLVAEGNTYPWVSFLEFRGILGRRLYVTTYDVRTCGVSQLLILDGLRHQNLQSVFVRPELGSLAVHMNKPDSRVIFYQEGQGCTTLGPFEWMQTPTRSKFVAWLEDRGLGLVDPMRLEWSPLLSRQFAPFKSRDVIQKSNDFYVHAGTLPSKILRLRLRQFSGPASPDYKSR